MFYFMNIVRSIVNYAIFCESCNRMRFEVDCAKSPHRIISEGLTYYLPPGGGLLYETDGDARRLA